MYEITNNPMVHMTSAGHRIKDFFSYSAIIYQYIEFNQKKKLISKFLYQVLNSFLTSITLP